MSLICFYLKSQLQAFDWTSSAQKMAFDEEKEEQQQQHQPNIRAHYASSYRRFPLFSPCSVLIQERSE